MKTLAEKFWSKVQRSTPDACWIWTGAKNGGGYGCLALGGRKARYIVMAHRVAWELAHGPISGGLEACHTCDVRKCVNPQHIFLGTQEENNHDMAAKGRARGPRLYGTKNPNARLTDAIAHEIRETYRRGGVSQRMLAQWYGVAQPQIWRVVTNQTWL